MKITRKVMIIIISITLITIGLSIYASQAIVNNLCEGEVRRSTGRTIGVLSDFDNMINELQENSEKLCDWFELAASEGARYNSNGVESTEKIKLSNKITQSPYSNLYLLDENYQITDILKEKDNFSDTEELEYIIKLIKEQGNSKESQFCGVISTKNYQYMACITPIADNIGQYGCLLIVEALSGDIYSNSESFAGSVFIEKINENDLDSFTEIPVGKRTIYVKYSNELVKSYTKIESYGNGGDIYISLVEKPQVIEGVRYNLTRFIEIIATIFIFANFLVYILFRKVVVNRMLKINTCVNKMINTFDLKTRIANENGHDEISVLSQDLNSMFTLLEQYSDRMKYISEHDVVTKLLNRRSIEQIGQVLVDNNESFSLAFIDLDNFKKINDSFGHNVGDEVLCKIADKIMAYDNKDISCARLGGDEFILLLKGNDREKMVEIIKDMFYKLRDDIFLRGTNYNIKASVGISSFPDNGSSVAEVLQNADIAMYSVKKNGGNNYRMFSKELLEESEIETKIGEGIKEGEFEVYFQPIGNLKDGKVNGAEALIRWNTESGIIPPDKFIPIAKKCGYIVDIDKLVIEQSCRLIREFLDKGIENFQVSINASFKLLSQKTFLSDLMETIRKHNIGVNNIKLEITEDETIDDLEYMVELLKSIRKCGIQVSLDDFGTGYSSFNYVKTLPLDVLKIDKSLLHDLDVDVRTENIIRTIINLAHILKLTVTCEGVETKEQLNLLEKLDCDNIQGYYLSRPLPVESFRKFLDEHMKITEDYL